MSENIQFSDGFREGKESIAADDNIICFLVLRFIAVDADILNESSLLLTK